MSIDAEAHVDVVGEQHVALVAYRYPGSPPFRDTDLDRRLFEGRTSEIDAVLHSILSSNLFVLYALSGLGKTSLLNAGVMPELRARGHWPVSVRLNDPARDPVELVRDQIVSAAEADPDVELQLDPSAGDPARADSSLWDLFAPLEVWRGNQLQELVVIFDQFEELFTLGWSATDRGRFIEQFGEVVRGHRLHEGHAAGFRRDSGALPPPAVKFVIVIREDSLGELEALATDVPQILRSRFRLGPLDPAQAEAAIRKPALIDDGRLHSPRFSYTPAACKEILDFLRTTTEHGTVVEGSAVDPSQLQIVCQYVERTIIPSKRRSSPDEIIEIDAPDLGGRSGLQRVLGDFYRRTLDSIPVAEQRAVRRLCERGLINAAGRRLSLEEGEISTTYDVSQVMLDHLVDARLLRADPRVGSVYYELAHDTLVAPILAFREEERARRARRTRRIALLGGGALAVVLLAVLVAVLASRSSSGDVTTRRLVTGETVTADLEDPGDVLLFGVEPSPVPLLALVGPVDTGSGSADGGGPNVAVEYTTPAGVTRLVDELGSGAPERVFVPPDGADSGRGELRVTASGSSVGSFEISLADVTVTELTGDAGIAGEVAAPGDMVVYSVEVDEGSRIAIDVTPVAASEPAESDGQSVKDLDVRLELIDATGAGSIVDEDGSGQSEAAAVGGTAGRYYVVVRGYETTTGPFTIAARPDDFVLALDEPKPGRIDAGSPVAEYVLDVTDPGTYAVEVLPDSKFDPTLTITDPTGDTRDVDHTGAGSTEFEVLGSVRGRYRVAVTGYELSTGGFSIEARRVQDALVLGQPSDGRIEDASDEAEFVVDIPGPGTYAVEVRPDADLDAILQISDQFGEPRVLDNAHAGSTEFELLRGAGGRYIVSVSGYETTAGDFEILIAAVDVVPLTDGTVSGSGTTAYEPTLADDELVEVRAEPDPAELVEIRVIDSAGYLVDGNRSEDAGDTASLVLSGAVAFDAQVVVRSDGPYAATFTPITPGPITSGSTVTTTGTSAYEITAGQEIVELRADPDASDSVDVRVFDPDGYPIEQAASPQPGGPASVVLAGDLAHGTRVVVRSGGSYAVSLSTIPVQPLAPGDIVDGTGTTVYDVESTADEVVELRVEPASADDVIRIQTIDRDGYLVDGDESAQPGHAASVPLTADLADDVQVVVRSDGAYTVSAVAVAVQPPPPGGTATASGTTAYEFTVATDELLEFRAVPGANGYVDVRVIDTSGYAFDGAESVSAGEPATVVIDGAFTPSQLVVVVAAGEHTDTVGPSP